MSKYPRSNPVSYLLNAVTREQQIPSRIRQVRAIFSSVRKQARAAYVFWRKNIEAGGIYKTLDTTEKIKYTLKGLDDEAAKMEGDFQKAEVYCLQHADPRQWEFQPEGPMTLGWNDHISLVRPIVKKVVSVLRGFQNRAYGNHRYESEGKKTIRIGQETVTPFRPRLKFDVFKDLSKRYPYVTAKNKARLARLYNAYWEVAGRFPKADSIYPYMLVAAGIPAAEVVGPWWSRSATIKSPMDWVRVQGSVTDGLGTVGLFSRSPNIEDWLKHLGMDNRDGALVESLQNYWRTHKQVPSEHWARRRSNELEEARKNAEIADQIPDVESWLKASRGWRKDKAVQIPPMPDPTFHVVEPAEAADLCRRARRDGLCVIDVIQNQLMDEDPYGEKPEDALDEEELERYKDDPILERSKAEGVCTLIVSTDPHRRTVVGLNEKGVCTSEHHCTGKNNEVDKIAWEYFRDGASMRPWRAV
jgi:hypothetical protein